MRIAVIDLGTNTFNLLITEVDNNGINTLYNEKTSVKLGRGGIKDDIILPDAFERGLAALTEHNRVIRRYKVDKTIALGTSALRTAKNACDFIKTVKETLDINIEIISGDREAELIYFGVLQSLENISTGNFLIIDIGGGSNEFILANKNKIIWKKSFKLGMQRLVSKFQISDPIKPDEIGIMEKYFQNELKPLFNAVKGISIGYIIGAEGSFESFYNMIKFSKISGSYSVLDNTSKTIDLKDYSSLHETILRSTASDRIKMKGLEPYRVDMIVAATVFVNYVISRINFKEIRVSPYSMKEGAAWEAINARV